MIGAVVAIAGAVYLTDKLFALVAWIEKEKALPRAPASMTEKDLSTPTRGGRQTHYSRSPPRKQGENT